MKYNQTNGKELINEGHNKEELMKLHYSVDFRGHLLPDRQITDLLK